MAINLFGRILGRRSIKKIEPDSSFTAFLRELASDEHSSPDSIATISFGLVTDGSGLLPFRAALAILLARRHHPGARLLLFSESEPHGASWDIVRAYVRWCPVPSFDHLNHWLARHAQGRMLLVRLMVLNVLGGMFASTDMLILRPMDDLARYPMVLGIQPSAPVARFAFGDGLTVASPGNVFSRIWLEECLIDRPSRPDDLAQLYDLACRLPVRLYAKAPDTAHILAHTAWFSPVAQRIENLLMAMDPDQALQLCSDNLALPLGSDTLKEKLESWRQNMAAQDDCLFARLVHSVLPQEAGLGQAGDGLALASGAA